MPPFENCTSGIIHRASALKQKNKKHNKLGHRTKGQFTAQIRGRTSSLSSLRSVHKHVISREERRNKTKQKILKKRDETDLKKKSLGSLLGSGPPHLVCVIPLHENSDSNQLIDVLEIQQSCSFSRSSQGILHLTNALLKSKYSFVFPSSNELYSVLDALKVCDTVLFLWKLGETLDENKLDLLSSLNHQAMPSTVHAIVGDIDLAQKKKIRLLKELRLTANSLFPKCDKFYNIKDNQEFLLLLRQISTQKRVDINFRDRRTHIIAETVHFTGDNYTGTLTLEGYIRGKPLKAESLMHVPGCENYQVESIHSKPDPYHSLSRIVCNPEAETLIAVPDPEKQESLDSFMEDFHYYGTTFDDDQKICDSESELSLNSDEEIEKRKSTRKLPRGTSDYQAAWLLSDDEDSLSDSEDEESSCVEREIDEFEFFQENSDEDFHEETEMEDWKRLKEATEDIDFIDEVDVPMNASAKDFFKGYRGLESFRSSPWDPNENLPAEYRRICHFPNFRHLSRKQLCQEEHEAECGMYAVIRLRNFPRRYYEDRKKDGSPFVAFSLLKYEQRMAVVNVILKSHHSRALQSGERLIFHTGISRFENNPIFSEHTTNNKHKLARFLHPGQFVMATMYAPVLYSPCPVSVYQRRLDGTQILVASGSVYSVNAKRVICERVILTGHPFKVNKKSLLVRFMFFNADDVQFFKAIKVATKSGNKGHITEPVGTHGRMKVIMKNQVKSQSEVITMKLYRRVFPSWSFDPTVRKPYIAEDTAAPPIFQLFDRTRKKVRFYQ